MQKNVDLLRGNIFLVLSRLALPLMGTSFVQMAYTLVDAMWLGRLSTGAVAAVGSCSFFLWISNALTLISKTGLSVTLSQSYGSNKLASAREYMVSGIQINTIICIATSIVLFTFKDSLLSFYRLSPEVHDMGVSYLSIVSLGLIFTFTNPILAVTFYSEGNSVIPFQVSVFSLIVNMILDPLLIFGFGPFPELGITGAALATVIAQIIGMTLLIIIGNKNKTIFTQVNYFHFFSKRVREIIKVGSPASFQTIIHALVGMVLNRYIASYGDKPIAVYSIGTQIESLTWMTGEGFSNAIAAFMGQNYGAKKYGRLRRGYTTTLLILGSISMMTSLLLFFGNESLFKIFLPNDIETIRLGGVYLKFLAFSQLGMSIEIGTAGALNGLGLTKYPGIIGIVFNILRIPIAKYAMPLLGLNGIWVSFILTCNLKGIFALIVSIYICLQKNP